MSDYIIRGESYFCVGRTMYEGLYSGCDAIIPGEDKDKNDLFEYEKFKNKIYLYQPGNSQELEHLLEKLSHQKVYNKTCLSNVDEYVGQFNNFIQSLVD